MSECLQHGRIDPVDVLAAVSCAVEIAIQVGGRPQRRSGLVPVGSEKKIAAAM